MLDVNRSCKMNILPAPHYYHEHNDCLDSSTSSKRDWLNSLHRGCLNKDTGDKFRLYSHLRALPSRELPDPYGDDQLNDKTQCSLHNLLRHSRSKSTLHRNPDTDSNVPLPAVSLSPVFREDSTRPPVTSEELTPELFKVDEFFNYLWSDSWREEICLRVVGGKLLKLLLTALYDLEKRQKLNSHIVHANLSNRRKYVVKEDVALNDQQTSMVQLAVPATSKPRLKPNSKKSQRARQSSQANKNASANADKLLSIVISKPSDKDVSARADNDYRGVEKPQDVSSEWRCESMVVQLIFYDKADASSVTYITPDKAKSGSESNMCIPLPSHVLYPAYSQAMHKMNYVRLPFSEDVDTKEQITTLTSELNDKLKIAVDTDGRVSRYASRQSLSGKDKFKLTKSVTDSPGMAEKQLVETKSECVTDNIWFHSKHVHKTASKAIRFDHEWIETAPCSSDSDHSSSLLSFSNDTDTSIYKKLNLSRKEMYVTGLYVPRTENKLPVEVKLQRKKMSKRKLYPYNNPENSNKYKSQGAHYQPTHASLLKENFNKRKPHHAPDSRIERKQQIKEDNISAKLWNQYIQKQEQMEMEMALNKSPERNIADRLRNTSVLSLDENTLAERIITARKRKSKRLKRKDTLSVTSGIDTPSQISSRLSSVSRRGEGSSISPGVLSGQQQLNVEPELGEQQLEINFNSNSLVELPRRRILSKRYLYVHEFQEPSIRTPRPPSDYQLRRSYQIMKHTPYVITHVGDGDVFLGSSEMNRGHQGNHPQRMYPGHYKMDDDNWSHMGFYPHGNNDNVINFSTRDSCGYRCPCAECECLREALADLKPDTRVLPCDYRHSLGKLSRDYDFLERNNYETPITVKQKEVISPFVTMDVPQICDHLMRLVDNVIFRKEILISSLGSTYITVTFSKGRKSKT